MHFLRRKLYLRRRQCRCNHLYVGEVPHNLLDATPYEEVSVCSARAVGYDPPWNISKHQLLRSYTSACPYTSSCIHSDGADNSTAMSRFSRADFRRWRSSSIRLLLRSRSCIYRMADKQHLAATSNAHIPSRSDRYAWWYLVSLIPRQYHAKQPSGRCRSACLQRPLSRRFGRPRLKR